MFTSSLSQNAQTALAVLGKTKVLPENTYLAGGSALALHFGHRVSLDFDFFTQNSFNQEVLALELAKIGTFTESDISKNTLLGLFNKVKFSIFKYAYPVLFQTHHFKGVQILDPRDIMAMKLTAIMDRGTKKDYIDLFFLSKKGIRFEDGFEYYDRKYKLLANNLYSILKSLTYFEEADASPMPKMLAKVEWDEIKDFFKHEAIRLAKKYI